MFDFFGVFFYWIFDGLPVLWDFLVVVGDLFVVLVGFLRCLLKRF